MAVPRQIQIVSAFAALYLIWGSTYLGILFAIQSIPPFLMAAHAFFFRRPHHVRDRANSRPAKIDMGRVANIAYRRRVFVVRRKWRSDALRKVY